MVVFVGRGIDQIPVDALTQRGIKVANGGATNSPPVAELGMSLLLASARNLVSGMH